jgi:hypothetical protein
VSKWSVFEIDGADEFHVAPCTEDGEVHGHHYLSIDCWCLPRIDDQNSNLIIHNDPARGGLNS